ncbi:MAG: hypothetical protein R6U78_11170 [Bacteroidales bacterium]
MPDNPGKLSRFWQEFKRRKVFKVIAMYAATAFILLEVVDIVTPALLLPSWTVTLVIVLLLVGFPIAVILSWIFDVTPEGIVKTDSMDMPQYREGSPGDGHTAGTGSGPGSGHESGHESGRGTVRGRKLLSVSNVMIAVLFVAVCILLYPKIFKPDRFKELRNDSGMITLAVLPFDNLTGDSALYFWQNGISEYLINRLGSSGELAVSSSQVVSDVLAGTRGISTASLAPDIARKTASKIDASTYVTGNFIGAGNDYSIMLNLVNTDNGELIWSTSVDGDLKGDYRTVLDLLSDAVRNYLEIKALENRVETDLSKAFPNSAEAYRHYIDGLNGIVAGDYESAIESLEMAYEIDTTFTFAAFYLAYAHSFSQRFDENLLHWTSRAYELRNNLPPVYRPWIELWYACYITKEINDIRRYLDMMYEAALHSRFLWFDLAVTSTNFMDDYENALIAFEKLEDLNRQWEDDWKYDRYYQEYAWTLLMADRPGEVDRITDIGLGINPKDGWLVLAKGAARIMMNDTAAVQRIKEEARSLALEYYGATEADNEHYMGEMHCWAKDTTGAVDYFRRAYEMGRFNSLFILIKCQLQSNMNIDECLRLSEYYIEQRPESWNGLYLKGLSLHKLGRHREALDLFREVEERSLSYHKWLQSNIREAERALAAG